MKGTGIPGELGVLSALWILPHSKSQVLLLHAREAKQAETIYSQFLFYPILSQTLKPGGISAVHSHPSQHTFPTLAFPVGSLGRG